MKNKNYRLIAYYLSIFIIIIGFIQLIPLIMLVFYPDESIYAKCFVLPGVLTILFGYLINYVLKDTPVFNLEKHYDSILVVAIWLLAITISSIPWMISKEYNFTQAFFEMTSGYSTTGLSVVDVNKCPHIFLFFRSVTLFVGGIGFVLILTAAINEKYSLNIYNAEGHNDRLLPNLSRGAKLIFSIYSGYIVIGTIAYLFAGMSMFDAINTSIAALSTGGFSVNSQSIYGYHSLTIEIITIVLMLLGQTNFVIHYNLLKRRIKPVIHHCETKMMIALLIVFGGFMTISLLNAHYSSNVFEAMRVSIFHFFSCLTTTGFQSVENLSHLPYGMINVMTLLMLIGGNAESTAGGIKQYRVVVILKGIFNNIKDRMTDSNVINTHYIERFGNKEKLENDEVRSTTSYVLLYLILFFVGSLIFTCFGYNLQDAMFEFSSCISTVGLSAGITNYSASNIILWTAIVGMFLGRLEIIVVFQSVIRLFRDSTNKGDLN